MTYNTVVINRIEWSRLGTIIEVGYRRSESDGEEDDWTLASCEIVVPNEDVEPFIVQIKDHFRARIYDAIQRDLP